MAGASPQRPYLNLVIINYLPARRVCLGVATGDGVGAADKVADLGRLGDERVEEALHLRRLAQGLLVVQGLRVQGWKCREGDRRNLFQPEKICFCMEILKVHLVTGRENQILASLHKESSFKKVRWDRHLYRKFSDSRRES